MKKYVIDIDGTICTQEKDYGKAIPFKERIKGVNKLFDKGHKIIFFTARGTMTGINWRRITKAQLKRWGVKYHKLIFGKPEGDFFIDDRGKDIKCLLQK